MYLINWYNDIIIYNILIFFFSWLGIGFSKNFIEAFFFLESVYLSLIICANTLAFIQPCFLFDLFILFILFFSICDSILGLIITLVSYKVNKTIQLSDYKFLRG